MWLVFLFFILIGIIFSELKITLLEVSKNFKVKVSLNFFKIIPVFIIFLRKEGIYFCGKNISYKKFIKNEKVDELKKNIKEIILDRVRLKNKVNEQIEILKLVSLKINKINFTLKIGLKDIFLTNEVIVLFSTIIPIYLRNINNKKIKYRILPDFNKFKFEFKGKISVSIRFLVFLKLYLSRNKCIEEKKIARIGNLN